LRRTTTGLIYKIDSVPSWVVANEIFGTDSYGKAIRSVDPKTFVDLGANVGYFPVAVAEHVRSRNIKGLCVEPNPNLQSSLMFHISRNKLETVYFRQGAVGLKGACREIDFFVNPSHIASSVSGKFNPLVPLGGESTKIRVPMLEFPDEWESVFSNERVDLLKIDIEGAEVDFLRSHSSFIKQVDAIFIEWHAWITNLSDLREILKQYEMVLQDLYHVDQHAGTALFKRI
jgi:FkbM family methyltransferase